MSAPLSKAEILFRQRLLKAEGFYTGKLDGVWGPKTEKADDASDDAAMVIDAWHRVDARSALKIATLSIEAQRKACEVIACANACFAGVVAKVVSGTRTYAEQDALYAQGRAVGHTDGDIVTNARGGESNHNFAIAWDIGLWQNGAYLPNSPLYEKIGRYVLDAVTGVAWGGLWPTPDLPHYQLATGLTVGEVRRRFEIGVSYFGDAR